MAIFAGLCLETLVAAEGVEGTCTEGCGPREGSALLQKDTARALDLVDEEVSSEELRHGWPDCWKWPVQQVDAAIAAEDEQLKVKNETAEECLKGIGLKIYWKKKKVEFLLRCLKRRFGYGDFVEDSVSEGNTAGDGALVEEGAAESAKASAGAGGLTDAEEEAQRSWPKCRSLTLDSGKKIAQEEQEEIEQWQTKRDTKCGLAVYWTKKKIEYLNKCKAHVATTPVISTSLTPSTT